MNQSERRRYLIQELIKENTQYNNLEIPQNKEEQKQLLRSLMKQQVPSIQELKNESRWQWII